MLQTLLPSLFDELVKLGVSHAQKLDTHLNADIKDWNAFETNLKSPRFASEVRKSSDADQKLKDYVTANNQYLRSKKLVLQVPSRTEGRMYSIKEMPGGRLGCSCKDWQYKRSWKGTDCEHVKAAKAGLPKTASMLMAAAKGAGLMRTVNKAKQTAAHGQEASNAVKYIRSQGYGT